MRGVDLYEVLVGAGIFVLIPLGGMLVGVIIQWLKTKERLLAIEKGVALPQELVHVKDPWERAAQFRVGGLVTAATGVGLFALMLALVLSLDIPKGVVAVAAIPFLVGLALLYEYRQRVNDLGPRPPFSARQPEEGRNRP